MIFKSSTVALMVSAAMAGNALAVEVANPTHQLGTSVSVANDNPEAFQQVQGENGVYLIQLKTPGALDKHYITEGEDRQAVVASIKSEHERLIAAIRGIDAEAVVAHQIRLVKNALYVQMRHDAVTDIAANALVDSVKLLDTAPNYTADDNYKPFPFFKMNDAGDNVTVAIVSTGIDYTHKALGGEGTEAAYQEALNNRANAWVGFPNDVVIGGFDFASDGWGIFDYNPIETPESLDPDGILPSGTMMASLVLEQAPDAKLMAYRTFDWSKDYLYPALEMVVDPNLDGDVSDRPDVLVMDAWGNMGFYQEDGSGVSQPTLESNILRSIAASGTLLVTHAGDIVYPHNFNIAWRGLTPEAMTVGSVKMEGDEVVLSHFTPAGPGRGDDNIKPDMVGLAENVTGAWAGSGEDLSATDTNAAYAAAHVAGVAARIMGDRPELSAMEVKALLTNTGSHDIQGSTTVIDDIEPALTITRVPEVHFIGGGYPDAEAAMNSSAVVWASDDYQPNLAFGFANVEGNASYTQHLTVKNLTDSVQSYRVGSSINGNKDSNAAIGFVHPMTVNVPANQSVSFPVTLTIDASRLAEWPIKTASDYTQENWLKATLNGYLVLTNEDDEGELQVPWLVMPKNAAAIQKDFETVSQIGTAAHNQEFNDVLRSYGSWAEAETIDLVNTSDYPQQYVTMPMMRSSQHPEQGKADTQGNILQHMAAGVYDNAMCESGKQLSVAVSMFDTFEMPMSNHFDKPGFATVLFTTAIYTPEMIEEFSGDPLAINQNARYYPQWQVASMSVELDNEGKPYTRFLDLSMDFNPAEPLARVRRSSIEPVVSPGGRAAVAGICLEDLYHHEIDAVEDFDQNLGWQFATGRDAVSSVYESMIEYNPVVFGEYRYEVIDHTGQDGYPNWWDSNCQPRSWNPNYCIEESHSMLGSISQLALYPDGVTFGDDYDWTEADWNYIVSIPAGGRARLSAATPMECNAGTVSTGNFKVHEDCRPGVLFFNTTTGENFVYNKVPYDNGVIPKAGQSFNVYEDVENGHIVGQVVVDSRNYFGTTNGNDMRLINDIPGTPFAVSSDGEISVINAEALDYESTKYYILKVMTFFANRASIPVDVEVVISNSNDIAPIQISDISVINTTAGEAMSQDISGHFVEAEGEGVSFTATGLPQGVEISRAGVIAGTAQSAGDFVATVSASDGLNSIQATVNIQVAAATSNPPATNPDPAPAPVEDITSSNSSGGSLGWYALLAVALLTVRRKQH